jgi:protein-L-isoaspartate(D-aspartate) O-methyltransferase
LLKYLQASRSGSPQRDRHELVRHLAKRGIRDLNVLKAMRTIPRHLFLANPLWEIAYADRPLPIEEGQTISQPFIVALMTEALNLHQADRVLEIGTGSGYQTAVLAELASEVYTVERFTTLSQKAKQLLESAGYHHIFFRVGDGTLGWSDRAPFDKIIATAACPQVPVSLLAQLRDGGRLVIPVGHRQIQSLLLVSKEKNGQVRSEELCSCSFLPLIGKEGWSSEGEFSSN